MRVRRELTILRVAIVLLLVVSIVQYLDARRFIESCPWLGDTVLAQTEPSLTVTPEQTRPGELTLTVVWLNQPKETHVYIVGPYRLDTPVDNAHGPNGSVLLRYVWSIADSNQVDGGFTVGIHDRIELRNGSIVVAVWPRSIAILPRISKGD